MMHLHTNNVRRPYQVQEVVLLKASILAGLMLNFSGRLVNTLVLKSFWRSKEHVAPVFIWTDNIIKDVFSFIPDFIYGFGIAWLLFRLRRKGDQKYAKAVTVGFYVSMVGGVNLYFAMANSGFLSWQLAFASFGLVLLTTVGTSVYLEWAYRRGLVFKSIVSLLSIEAILIGLLLTRYL